MITLKEMCKFPWRNVCIVFISIIYIHHTYNATFIDEDCKKIISPSIKNEEHTPWWPSHCALKEYTSESIFSCMKLRRDPEKNFSIAFMGDSFAGGLYKILIKMMGGRSAGQHLKISDLHYLTYNEKHKIEIQLFVKYTFNNSVDELFSHWEDINYTPDVFVINCNIHPIIDNRGSSIGLHNFRKNLTRQLLRLSKMSEKSTLLWYVQPPLYTPRESVNLTNLSVSRYNAMVMQVLRNTKVHIWTSIRLVAVGELQNYQNDIHIPPYQIGKAVTILLNFICNSYNNDTSNKFCCSQKGVSRTYFNKYSAFTAFSVVFLCFVSTIKKNISLGMVVLSSPFVTNSKLKEANGLQNALFFTLKCGIYFSFVYIFERTALIPRQEKYSGFPFIAATIILLLFALSSQKISKPQNFGEILFLETKGIMISCIILLNLSTISSSKAAISIINVFESNLLILNGAQMFQEFWRRECSTFIFLLKKILPLNFLLIIFCWLLDKNYEFYGLIPVYVITFHIYYLPLMIPFHKPKDSQLRCLNFHFLKIFTILLITASVFKFWEKDFLSLRVLSNLFLNQDGLPDEAMKQWQRNKFSFGIGMLFGIIHEQLSLMFSSKIQEMETKKGRFYFIYFLLGCLAVSSTYVILTEEIQEIFQETSYLIFLTTLCYLLIRFTLFNCYHVYSKTLYQVGNCWLQIFIIQFHTILAFNGTTVLQLIPFPPFVNQILLFSVTIFLAFEFQSVLSLETEKENAT